MINKIIQKLYKVSGLLRDILDREFMSSVMEEDIERIKKLLDLGVNPDTIIWGSTALHKATMEQNIEIMEILLEKGANIDAKDDHGLGPRTTPLSNAIKYKKFRAAEFLIEKRAKRDEELRKLSESLFRKVPLGRDGRVYKIGEEKKQKVVLKLVPLGRAGYVCDDGIRDKTRKRS